MPPGKESNPVIEQKIAELRQEMSSAMANLETEVRVCKHDVDNLRTMFTGFGVRFDKFEERIGIKLDLMMMKLNSSDVQQARGVGFFAGMGAVITVAGSAILAIAKVLFSHG